VADARRTALYNEQRIALDFHHTGKAERNDAGGNAGREVLMKLTEYVKHHMPHRSQKTEAEERKILGLIREDPTQSASALARKMNMQKYIVQARLSSLSRQRKIKYVRMWVPLDEIEE